MRCHMVMRRAFISLGLMIVVDAGADPSVLYGIGNATGDGSSNLYRIDNYAVAPTAVNLGETGLIFLDIAIDPSDPTGYGVASDGGFYRIDLTNGVPTLVSSSPGGNLNAMEWLASGVILSWGSVNTNLYEVDPATGVFTLLFDVGFASGGDLAEDVNGDLYGATSTQLIRIDIGAQSAEVIGDFGFEDAFGLEVDVDGVMYVMRGSNGSSGTADLYTVNKSSGSTTLIGAVANASSYGCYGIGLVPGVAACPADLTNDGIVNPADLAALLAAWGPCQGCPEDLDDDRMVGASDLAALLAAWGEC